MGRMRLITLHLPESWIAQLDGLVKDGFYGNRNLAIKAAVRDLLKDEVWRENIHAKKEWG